MATLFLLDDDGGALQQWNLTSQPVTIGRGSRANAKIDDDGLSRRHFMIAREGDDYVVKDLGSRNGTWVDGDREMSAVLFQHHSILAGKSKFHFAADDVLPVQPKRRTGPHDTVIIPFLDVVARQTVPLRLAD